MGLIMVLSIFLGGWHCWAACDGESGGIWGELGRPGHRQAGCKGTEGTGRAEVPAWTGTDPETSVQLELKVQGQGQGVSGSRAQAQAGDGWPQTLPLHQQGSRKCESHSELSSVTNQTRCPSPLWGKGPLLALSLNSPAQPIWLLCSLRTTESRKTPK